MSGPDPATAATILRRHGLIAEDAEVRLTRLEGGVSADVLLADAGTRRLVLKRPRERFAVADDWRVETRRAAAEHAAGTFLRRHLGRHILPILAYDVPTNVLVIEAAPRGWRTWKQHLLDGQVRPATARAAGRLLAGIHGLSDWLAPDELREDALFDQQRIDPYLRTAAAREPDAAAALAALETDFAARDDLVHGDFSPKNLFTDPAMESLRLIDHEVVTRGDAAFDVGFLLTHLVMKAMHRPADENMLHEAAAAFLDTYQDARVDDEADPPYAREARAMRWLSALLLARAVGKSRVEYLDEATRLRLRDTGLRMIEAAPERLRDALAMAR